MDFAGLSATYRQPFFVLLQQARRVFEAHWPRPEEMQLCTLLSIKTGGCSEDCSYCAQSAHYQAGVQPQRLLEADQVLASARAARENGSTRFCMGAAWRGVRSGDAKFNQVLEIVREVAALGMEVCVTLGQLGPGEAAQLKAAGVTAYNHNIDTSPEHYPEIVRTHTFADRLRTIDAVQKSGLALCCGGIIGLGESIEDRLRMLAVLTSFEPAPESVPINCLMAMPGTPLEDQPPVDVFELVRLIATARIALPRARVRLSAGRSRLSPEGQALCFFAGANSVFHGDKLLTAANPAVQADLALLRALDLKPLPPTAPPAQEKLVPAMEMF
jgi:biotin synthase